MRFGFGFGLGLGFEVDVDAVDRVDEVVVVLLVDVVVLVFVLDGVGLAVVVLLVDVVLLTVCCEVSGDPLQDVETSAATTAATAIAVARRIRMPSPLLIVGGDPLRVQRFDPGDPIRRPPR